MHSIFRPKLHLPHIDFFVWDGMWSITAPHFWGHVKGLIACCVWAGLCGVRRQCETSCFVGKIREQSWWSLISWAGRQTTETLKREKGKPTCLKRERLIEWFSALKVWALCSVMCLPVRKKMLISGLPAWLLVGAKNMERASQDRGWCGGGLTSSRLHLWLNYYEALRQAWIAECRLITATK